MRLSAHCLSQPLIYVVPSDGLRLGLGGVGGVGGRGGRESRGEDEGMKTIHVGHVSRTRRRQGRNCSCSLLPSGDARGRPAAASAIAE